MINERDFSWGSSANLLPWWNLLLFPLVPSLVFLGEHKNNSIIYIKCKFGLNSVRLLLDWKRHFTVCPSVPIFWSSASENIVEHTSHLLSWVFSEWRGKEWMAMPPEAEWVCEIQLDLRTMKLPETPGNVIVGLGTRMQVNHWFFLGDIKEQLQRSLHKIEVIKRFSPSAVWKEYWKIRTSVACGEELEAPYCGYNCITSWSDEFQLYRRPKI